MIKTQLAKAISMTLAGVALAASASTASAHTMYNTFSATGPSATDGWTHIADDATGPKHDGIGTGPESKGHLGLIVPWSGTTGGALPFGYAGSAHLNWAAAVHHLGTMEVSTADAIKNYGLSAEIDTGAGAWRDANGTGWKHQTDLGLIKSDINTTIRLNLTTLGSVNNNFGVTVFKGMDTTTGDYSHHGGWNNPSVSRDFTDSNPFYYVGTTDVSTGTGMTYLTHDETVDAVNYIEFFAEAGQVYTIALGGNGVGRWSENVADYKLSITAVPVPGAVWLFGSAMAGLISFGRRKAV
jgi:hypothetical protein